MIDKMIGFIGAGNMGQAMIGGILKSGLANTSQIIASAHSAATLEKLQTTFSIETTLSNEIVAQRSELLFLAVKPNKFGEILPQIVPVVKPSCVIVSIAAGITVASIENAFGRPVKVVRAMPNTPALIGEGMSALCANDLVTSEELTPLSVCPAPPLPMSICLLRQWQMLLSQTECRAARLISSLHSPCSAQQRWY